MLFLMSYLLASYTFPFSAAAAAELGCNYHLIWCHEMVYTIPIILKSNALALVKSVFASCVLQQFMFH